MAKEDFILPIAYQLLNPNSFGKSLNQSGIVSQHLTWGWLALARKIAESNNFQDHFLKQY